MKKVCLIVALCLLLSCFTFSVSAETQYDYEQGKTVTKTLPAVWLLHFEPTDITGAVAVKFDFFVDSAANFRISAIEFGSHYRNDWQEIQYTGVGKWPTLQDGWNTVTFEFNQGVPVKDVNPNDGTEGAFDHTSFQRIRIFNITGSDPSVTIGLRNIVAVKADGTEIKVGGLGTEEEPTVEYPPILDITVQPGSDETSLNFNWIATQAPTNARLEIAPVGGDFDETKTVFEATVKNAGTVGVSGNDILCRYACKATATGLRPGKSYRYRVGYGDHLSEITDIATQSNQSTSAYILSDIHVIEHASWQDKLQVSVDNWQITLGQLIDRGEADLILSLGDQMQDTGNLDYLDGFFGVENLTNVTLAPINGNHDLSPASKNLPNYTNVPNQVYPDASGICDYYFKSGNTLFVMLSLTDINFNEVDHDKTFKEAIAAYPDYDWMVVSLHEAIYGYYLNGFTADKGDALDYCNEVYEKYIEIIDRYSPDVCLTGHSHSYMRSHFMKNGDIQEVEQDDSGAFKSPTGTLYINMGTSSRMWQFQNQDPTPNWPWSYSAFSVHGHASYTFGLLETSGNKLSIEVRDNLKPETVIDTVTIVKTLKEKPVETEKPTETEAQTEAQTNSPTIDETQDTTTTKGGCGSVVVSGGALLLVTAMASGICFVRKKKD